MSFSSLNQPLISVPLPSLVTVRLVTVSACHGSKATNTSSCSFGHLIYVCLSVGNHIAFDKAVKDFEARGVQVVGVRLTASSLTSPGATPQLMKVALARAVPNGC